MSDVVRVKVLEDIEEFVWEDGGVYGPFKKGSTIILPVNLANLLKERGKVEILEKLTDSSDFERFLIASNNDIRVWLFISNRGTFITVSTKDNKIRTPINIVESIKAFKKLQELIQGVVS